MAGGWRGRGRDAICESIGLNRMVHGGEGRVVPKWRNTVTRPWKLGVNHIPRK